MIERFLDKISSRIVFGEQSSIGLSIGSSSIKLVELSKKGKLWNLRHFGVVQLPEEIVVNREIINPVGLVESIKTLVNQMQLKNRRVCSSISGAALIVKKMTLDGVDLKDLQEQVFWEAEQYLPFDVSEVVMDYHLISHVKGGRTEVIVVAVKKTVLESYLDCITKAGLVPAVMDVDFFALQNLYEVNYPVKPSEAVALIDIGAASLKLVIVANGVPIFTKDSSIGGNLLTSEIQRVLSLSFADAESLKTAEGSEGIPQEVIELMSSVSETIAIEIKKGLDFYQASSSGPPLSSILIAGGSAKIPRLSKVIEDLIGFPTQVLNPFNAIVYSPEVFTSEYLSRIGAVAAVPIGLAIRSGGARS